MMEIKRLIEQLQSAANLEAYYNSEYNGLYNHAANALEELQAELEQVKEERDAAVALVHEWEQYGRYLSPMGFTVPPNWKEE